MDRMTQATAPSVARVIDIDRLTRARSVVRSVYLDDKVKDYIIDVVFATRDPAQAKLADLAPLIEMGASPRASIALNIAARAHAFLQRRAFVAPEDIKAIGPDVLRHRIKLTYEAEAENVRVEDVVRRVFETVAIP